MSHLVIGIEGLVGAGKTSICREILHKIPNSVLLNGGNLYRAIVYAMMQNGKKIESLKKLGKNLDIKTMMDIFNINIKMENHETIVYIDNVPIEETILQSKEASLAVSTIGGSADNQNLFLFARNLIDDLKKDHHVIVSGRSIMEIYPDIDYHFFITASLEERVRRKCIQYGNTEKEDIIRDNIIKRDNLQKKAGFYRLYPKTIEIDVTDCESVEASTILVLENIHLPELV